jgi:hypothetical protein
VRARDRIEGGLFDSLKLGKSKRMINFLWSLCLVQFCFSMMSPSVFAVALYTSLKHLRGYDNLGLSWIEDSVFELGGGVSLNYGGLIIVAYLFVYTFWVLFSFFVPVILYSALSFLS